MGVTEWDDNAAKNTRFSDPNYRIFSDPSNWQTFKETNFELDPCLCAVGGCDQTSCRGNAQCIGGRCDQSGIVRPSCPGGNCNQVGAINPKCVGGYCVQDVVTESSCVGGGCVSAEMDSNYAWQEQEDRPIHCDCFSGKCDQRGCLAWATCMGGGCNQQGLEGPTCLGGRCCQDGSTMATCLGGFCGCDDFSDS